MCGVLEYRASENVTLALTLEILSIIMLLLHLQIKFSIKILN